MTFSSLPLSYCTNVHPGRTVEEVVQGVSEYTAKVRQRLDLPIAAGLWLPASAIAEINESPDRNYSSFCPTAPRTNLLFHGR